MLCWLDVDTDFAMTVSMNISNGKLEWLFQNCRLSESFDLRMTNEL